MSRRLGLVVLGAAIGLAGAIAWRHGRAARDEPAAQLLSDCDGAIATLAIHATADALAVVAPVYHDLLRQLPAEIELRVVVPDRRTFTDLLARVGPVNGKLTPVVVGHPITPWSRDRWLALRRPTGGRVTLLHPWEEMGADGWPARRGDAAVAGDLAAHDPAGLRAERSALFFDGGDFVADRRTILVSPRVAERNLGRAVGDVGELASRLDRRLGRHAALLDRAPPHHAGMSMMLIGEGRVMVGDPALARPLLADSDLADATLPGGADWSAGTQTAFDAVAARCEALGLAVSRIPIVPGRDGRTYLTWLNVILDQRDGRRIAYVPVFADVEPLNAAALAIWREHGYEVRPIDCTTVYRLGGSLRCLVNVIDRG